MFHKGCGVYIRQISFRTSGLAGATAEFWGSQSDK
jgi:hypothetical protein